jgi:ferredoxin
MGEQLRVDRIRCDGHGLCAELLPELIGLDDWGYPILRDGSVPSHLLDHARRAVDACPVLALRLQKDAIPSPRRGDGVPPGKEGNSFEVVDVSVQAVTPSRAAF